MSKETEEIESLLVSGNGGSRSVVANGGSPLRKRGLPFDRLRDLRPLPKSNLLHFQFLAVLKRL